MLCITLLLGLSAFFFAGALLSAVTKKTFLGVYVSPRGLVLVPPSDASNIFCQVPEKKRVHFLACGGFF